MTITWMNLKDARALRGWTQAQLAEALGVHQKTIVNWESTGVPPKREYMVRRILAEELEYSEYVDYTRAAGRPLASFDEWMEASRDTESAIDELNKAIEAGEVDASESRLDGEALRRHEQFEEHVKSLSRYSSVELLNEVSRRVRSMEQDLSEAHHARNVPDSADTQEDYGLVAKKRSKDRGEDVE
jgi:transcriptional regulator with XRE-family HTH domain